MTSTVGAQTRMPYRKNPQELHNISTFSSSISNLSRPRPYPTNHQRPIKMGHKTGFKRECLSRPWRTGTVPLSSKCSQNVAAIRARERRWRGHSSNLGGRVMGEDDRGGAGRAEAEDFLTVRAGIVDVSKVVVDANPPPAFTLDLQPAIGLWHVRGHLQIFLRCAQNLQRRSICLLQHHWAPAACAVGML